ncbi:DNA polymerase III subunit gamma and tau [Nocardioides daejeonensis]|uniref:DNA polymerase III subunit gamma and tau n=1 Tax=Nocardioides daejeonensis TaxID=1046556 RepID=UPI000D749637|nr:DNA polymerase III subunit gamma and tau [Nocardioides daejeonensis]
MDAPLALYRRYRPETFAEVIGQEHVTEPLRAALANNRVNHAYLFSGPRGCGKTTSARILARALNCERAPIADPCGECESCRDLARGGPGSIDVIEIDAASHGGVDDARDLREKAFFAPVKSRYKVYIIDEAHMVSPQGFNALLKLVEEPPPHLRFIFATTEPEKVLPTIRSRTHHYPFRLIPPKLLSGYLSDLCQREGVPIDAAALPLVVRAGGGSARDTLSVLDQLLGGAGAGGVTHQLAAGLLGYTPDSLLDEIVDAFAAADGAGVFGVVDKVIETGQDPRRFTEDLLRRLRDLVIIAAVPDAPATGLIDLPQDAAERLTAQAARFGVASLTRAADLFASGLTEMRGATAPRLLLELVCSRVLLPAADHGADGLAARLDRLERRVAMTGDALQGSPVRADVPPQAPASPAVPPAHAPAPAAAQDPPAPEPPAPSRHQPVQAQAPTETASAEVGAADQPAAASPAESTSSSPGPSAEEGWSAATTAPMPEASTQQAQPAAAPQPSAAVQHGPSDGAPAPEPPREEAPTAPAQSAAPAAGGLSLADVRRLWPDIVEATKTRRRVTWIHLTQNAQVVAVDASTLTLGFTNAGARDSFVGGGSDEIVRQAAIDIVGQDWKVVAIVDPGAQPGEPAPVASRPAVRPAEPEPRPEPWMEAPQEPAPPDWAGAEPPSPEPSAAVSAARAAIAPTRTGDAPVERGGAPEHDPDADATLDDPELENSGLAGRELIERTLGGRVIEEIRHD